jgi:hypothetical protein
LPRGATPQHTLLGPAAHETEQDGVRFRLSAAEGSRRSLQTPSSAAILDLAARLVRNNGCASSRSR